MKNDKASFYLLQIKPLVGSGAGYAIDPETVYTDDMLLVSRKSMGNGLIDDITDLIYVEPDKFDNLKTNEMADEIDAINRKDACREQEICADRSWAVGHKGQVPGHTRCMAADIKCQGHCRGRPA
ncbi:MAG: hypothetical protein MZV63_54845 [Marinilabiliales bacterium]|nr:hypothetical protein [Marinilabiliales bacterium]